ncbi:MAG: aspartyl protease family protein [Candidatus Aminicenantes bacterium]|nr:aspartyl protease family protein [Candidatus Aminicenantes bacterium]
MPMIGSLEWKKLPAAFRACLLGLGSGILLTPFSSCRAGTHVSISPAGEGMVSASPAKAQAATFWEAMENAEFDWTGSRTIEGAEAAFAGSLNAVMGGMWARAEDLARKALDEAKDPVLAAKAGDLLFQILFHQSKWEDLSALRAKGGFTLPEGNTILLAEAFRGTPEERYLFPESPVRRPISLTWGGNPVVEVEVNGRRRKFWIDTGAGLSVIASDAAEDCGVASLAAGEAEARAATGRNVGVRAAAIRELKIGGLEIRNHPVMIIDKRNLEVKLLGLVRLLKIDGLIGWNAIRHIDMEIDYGGKQVILRKPVKRDASERRLVWLGQPVVRLHTGDGRPVLFGLDTGSRATSLTETILGKIDAAAAGEKSAATWSAGGSVRARTRFVSGVALVLGGFRFDFEKIAVTGDKRAVVVRLDGIIGSDILQDTRLSLDAANGRFEIERGGKAD